jgi:hypothetical protein
VQDLAIDSQQPNSVRMRQRDEFTVVGQQLDLATNRKQHRRNGKLAAFKTCLRFANDFLRGMD